MAKPRQEVVSQLASDALDAMEAAEIPDLTAAEVMSACYTMTKRITRIVINGSDATLKDQNVEVIMNAIAELYALLPPTKVH